MISTNGYEILVDPIDVVRLLPFNWSVLATGYVAHSYTVNRQTYVIYMHRLISLPPPGMEVDHVNGNRIDNRKRNLRWATRAQNATNYLRENASGYRGVQQTESGRYVAKIAHLGKQIHLGRYDTAEEAAKAYDKAAKLYQGSFARLNFME